MQFSPDQCIDPLVFAVHVACMLRFYNCLSRELAENFGSVLDIAASRASMFLHEDIGTLPWLTKPMCMTWRNQVPECDPADLGLLVTGIFTCSAKTYSQHMWKISFDRLSLNHKALAIHHCDAPDVDQALRLIAHEIQQRGQMKERLTQMAQRINQLCEMGACEYAELEAIVLSCNSALKNLEIP